LILNVMRFQDELVDPSKLDLPREGGGDKPELEMAEKLIGNLTEPFDPSRYTDEYREELLRLIHDKVKGKEPEPARREASPKGIDIMSALKASLDQTRRVDRGAGKRSGRRASPARRSAA